MSITVNWPPNPETDMASYEIQRADNLQSSPWTVLGTVPSTQSGPNWDPVNHVYIYLDTTGDESKFYRLVAIDTVGNRSVPSTPFQPIPTQPAIPNTVKIDQNYGSVAALRYQTAAGVPVEGALIRVYRKSDFDQGLTDAPLAVGMTNVNGDWVNPIYLTTGFTYVVQFAKEGLYGPDKTEIVV